MTSSYHEFAPQNLARLNQAPIRAAAQAYAEDGWAVFPVAGIVAKHCSCRFGPACASPGKHPLLRNGLHGATTDPAVIADWWHRWPWAGIGIATGVRSRLVVVDIDPDHGGNDSASDLARRGSVLPETLSVRTGGGGRHLFYHHPGSRVPNTAGRLPGAGDLPGIDLRGDGGYIIAAPSPHASGGRYQWDDARVPIAPLPIWARDRPPSVAESKPIQLGEGRLARYAEAALEGEVAAVRAAPEGERNVTLNRAAFKLGTLVGGGVLHEQTVHDALTQAADEAGLGRQETSASIRSGLTAGAARPRHLLPAPTMPCNAEIVHHGELYPALTMRPAPDVHL